MTRFYTIAKTDNSLADNLNLAKEKGYTHIFMWINSDLEWNFFANSYQDALSQAIDLYMKEKKIKDIEFAKIYYSEYIDIYNIDEYLEIIL